MKRLRAFVSCIPHMTQLNHSGSLKSAKKGAFACIGRGNGFQMSHFFVDDGLA